MNIVVSIFLHGVIIIAAFVLSGGDAVLLVSDYSMKVSLLKDLSAGQSDSLLVKKEKTGAVSPRLDAQIPRQDDKEPKISHKKNPAPARRPVHLPDYAQPEKDKGEALTGHSELPVRYYESNGLTISHERAEVGSRVASIRTETLSGAAHGAGGTGRDFLVPQKASDNSPDIRKEIRSAIEKAKQYPRLAKKRGIEGTVTTVFTINKDGYPENIVIVTGSGFSILDSAARKTIQKASPFPVVKGLIEVPITFRLKKGR